jgi:hypothetical protein
MHKDAVYISKHCIHVFFSPAFDLLISVKNTVYKAFLKLLYYNSNTELIWPPEIRKMAA